MDVDVKTEQVKNDKINTSKMESLALPRLIADERENPARVNAINLFVTEHFQLGVKHNSTQQQESTIHITESALPQLTALS